VGSLLERALDGSAPWPLVPDLRQPGLSAAFEHFWNNDVVGNLQGEYDQVWAAVASYFRNDPWVIGYDP